MHQRFASNWRGGIRYYGSRFEWQGQGIQQGLLDEDKTRL